MNNFLMVIHVNFGINNFIARVIDDSELIFHNNIPTVADPNMSTDNCISILGNFDPNKFMNAFIKKIQKIDNDDKYIVASTDTVRISVGLEDPSDLTDDIKQALADQI